MDQRHLFEESLSPGYQREQINISKCVQVHRHLLARLGDARMYASKKATFNHLRSKQISSARNQAHLQRAGSNSCYCSVTGRWTTNRPVIVARRRKFIMLYKIKKGPVGSRFVAGGFKLPFAAVVLKPGG